jgi:hypothetical protein
VAVHPGGLKIDVAAVGSSHDDAHVDNSTLHTGVVRPSTGFVDTSHRSVRAMAVSFLVCFVNVRFSLRMLMHPYY